MISWLSKLKTGLTKTKNVFTQNLKDIFINRKLDDDTLDELEETLILADLGAKTSALIVDNIRKKKYPKDTEFSVVINELSDILENILKDYAKKLELDSSKKTNVFLVCGVNGNGKTTTTAKLANLYKSQGYKVLVAACDTFRAAAVTQLQEWANRINIDIVTGEENSDPASVAYKAVERAQQENYDLLIIDTAGRLHNKSNLMQELEKICRVIKKLDESAPHQNLLVLDATTGQNAFKQVEVFHSIINISGLIITKLDGTAKGGVVIGLAQEFKKPIYAIGVGEKVDDLNEFKAQDFIESLLNIEG